MANFSTTLVSGQAPVFDGADDITQVMPASEPVTQVLPAPESITQVMAPAANDQAAVDALWTARGTQIMPAAGPPAAPDVADLAEPATLPKIPGRSDEVFLQAGMRGTPAGEAHYEAVKAISDDIARQKADPAYLASEESAAQAAGIQPKGPAGRAWFEQQYGAGRSAAAAEEELGAVSGSMSGETSALGEMGELGEEASALGQVGKALANPAVAAPLAGLNVIGGAADVASGIAEVSKGQVGYGVADTAVGATNMYVGGAALADLATTGAVAASPLGVVAGAAGLGVKGDKFLKQHGLLDSVFGKDENGESYGLMGGIGHTLNKAIHGDGVAIAESLAGASMLPLLIPALISTEVDSGLTSLAASGIDWLGGDSKAVGHAISDTAGGMWDGAKSMWEHFSE